MKKENLLEKWLWFGLKEEEAQKYQREIAVDNLRIVKKESLVITILCGLYGLYFISKEGFFERGLSIFAGVIIMLLVYVASSLYLKKNGDTVARTVSWIIMATFIACAYGITIYLGTFESRGNLAVTCVSLFIFLQINFDLLPRYNMVATVIAAIVFFVCSYLSKPMGQFIYDVMDALLAIIIGAIVAWEKSKIKWENAIAHEKLEKDRDIDILTGLWNRQAFERHVEHILKEKQVESMAVAMIDLDKFKRINDSYGHGIGDEYLCHFSEIFLQSVKKNTIVGRRSGDEFFLFIYNFVTVENLEQANVEFQNRLKEMPIILPDGKEKVIQISMGVSWTKDVNIKWTQLLAAADEQLYYIKEHGRNGFQIEEYKR